MLDLIETQTVNDDGALNLASATKIDSVVIGGVTYVAVAAGDAGITIFKLSKTGILKVVAEFDGSTVMDGVSSLAFVQSGGSTWLAVSPTAADWLAIFSVGADGSLTEHFGVEAPRLGWGSQMLSVQIGGTPFVLADNGEGGLVSVRVEINGYLTSIDTESTAFDRPLTGLSSVQVGGSTFIVGSTNDSDTNSDNLRVFLLDGDGQLTLVDVAGGDSDWVSSTAVVVNGAAWVYASTATAIVTYALGADGALTEVVSIPTGNATVSLTTGVVDGVTHLFVATDYGLSTYVLLSDGQLEWADTDADTAGNHLASGGQGKLISIDGVELYVAPSTTEGGVTVLTGNPIANFSSRADSYSGTSNGDLVSGGAGDDTLYGGYGNDRLLGGAGADYLSGDADDDYLDGGADADQLYGGFGKDELKGGLGDDALDGGYDDDILDGGAGADAMTGGSGNDIYFVDNLGDTIVEYGNEGTDTVRSLVNFTLSANVEKLILLGTASEGRGNTLANTITGTAKANALYGFAGSDTLYGDGGADTLDGGDDDDTLDGGAGDDTLIGGAGSDRLYGGLGNDRLDGGTGFNQLYGGAGNDTYVLNSISDSASEDAGGGTDTLIVRYFGAVLLSDNFENVVYEADFSTIIFGNALNNVIQSHTGGDMIFAGLGKDTVDGGDGADVIYGNEDNDILSGGAGDDMLAGGQGNDRLSGGTGADRFDFDDLDVVRSGLGGVAAKDTILDLNFAEGDFINLSGIDANALTTDAFEAFTWVTKFTRTAGQATIKYVAASNITTVLLDVDGDGRADLQINIAGNHAGTTGNLYTGDGDTDGGWIL